MDREKKDQDLPSPDQSGAEEEAKRNRAEMDDVPPHGTDPLHEGP